MSVLNFVNDPKDIKNLSISELKELAQEIREFLIENVVQTGGHLAPNLGVVELTIALHYVFDTPIDSFIWDVGHQAYVHKILTGRKNQFSTLRKKNGLSGYPSPEESIHDLIHAGHSSTSVSIGVGVATAKKISNKQHATVAIIGDGSFTSGMVYEALNDASWRDVPLIIVLNDNKMSISQNVGGIAAHLNVLRTNRNYLTLKKSIYRLLSKTSLGDRLAHMIFRIKSTLKSVIYRRHNFFQNLGVKYLGPFDGHDIENLISLFQYVKNTQSPILLHVLTEKGLGHPQSMANPIGFHGISEKDDSIPLDTPKKTWSKSFGDVLIRCAEKDNRIFAITAAMREGTGLAKYAETFSDRFIDVGIAEQHAVSCALGLSLQGMKPVVAVYSTFMQRAYDQVLHDIGIANKPVIICMDRAGVVPADGKTHQGVFDISFMRTIPNIVLMSPICEEELELMMNFALDNSYPVAIRYPKDTVPEYRGLLSSIVLGEGVEIESGQDGVIVIFGSLLEEALQARELLQKHHKSYAVYHIRFAKPIASSVWEYIASFSHIVVVEEGIANGGLGAVIQQKMGFDKVSLINTGDEFPATDTRQGLKEQYHFTAEGMTQVILESVNA